MQTGDRCPCCRQGQMRVRSSEPTPDGERYVRYFTCNQCDHRESSSVPSDRVIRRKVCGIQG